MCKPILSQELLSKPSLIEELGGKTQLHFLLINFSENIKEDTDLQKLFGHMNINQLTSVMTNLVNASFENNLLDEKARNDIVMKNYAVFELGINKSHFEKLKTHFECALRFCWIGEELIDECTERFGAMQSIFEAEGASLRKTANAHRKLASKFQAAPPVAA